MDADLFADDAPPARKGWRVRATELWSRRAWPDWFGSLKLRITAGALVVVLLGIAATA